MARSIKLANEAWEALHRAQATIAMELTEADIWGDLLPSEYGVLHALSNAPRGLRISELRDDALLITQPGMSRLVIRLEARGLVGREDDPDDARACRIRLTPAGAEAQRLVGRAVARHVAEAMTRALGPGDLAVLRDLTTGLLASARREGAGRAGGRAGERAGSGTQEPKNTTNTKNVKKRSTR
ncbi:MarR family winged helix-turn-helix transcriptional regulator [Streptomyces sp. NPDC020917]|uniref:MarR family winged helix-turn-helix transcriptional regulator n=1 Tax=Streptomyces sp. NPDC020917 TaxID=3365102 RepID=UPI0037AA37A5